MWSGSISKDPIHEESPRGVVVNMLNCYIVVSEVELQSPYYDDIWTNALGKSMNSPIPSTAMGKLYRYFSSTMIDLALNNP